MGVGGRATPRSVAEKSAGFVKPGRVAAKMTERMQASDGTVGIIGHNPNGLGRFAPHFCRICRKIATNQASAPGAPPRLPPVGSADDWDFAKNPP